MPIALVTCGPAYEPIDDVRRITNNSTGELGSVLAETLTGAGFEVLCVRGETAGYPPPKNAKVVAFSTNASMVAILEELVVQPDVIFHAAALCDFMVRKIEGIEEARKIRSSTSELHLILSPAEKVLPRLRILFPNSVLVGWKYELDGSRADAIMRARKQIDTSRTDACVVNGSAYGAGFGFLTRESAEVRHLGDKAELSEFLAGWALDVLNRSSESARGDRLPPFRAGQSALRISPR